ncbi:MAG: hypothetical protein V2I57_02700 [Xanthomonadales bacterium]|nr:hypothetical protein [Xanthomonadales bacterium]
MRTVLLSLIWLAGLPAIAAAQRVAEIKPDGEIPRPEISAAQREWNAWAEPLWCQLLDHPIPLVRIHAHTLILSSNTGPSPVTCPNPLPSTSDFRLEAVLADPDNPALLATVYGLECDRQRPADWCRTSDLREKLLAADPVNAFPHLLYLQDLDARRPDRVRMFSDTELQHLLKAASAKRVDSYWGAGLPEVYEAIESIVADWPPNDWSADARAEFDDLGYDLDDPSDIADLASIPLLFAANPVGPYAALHLHSACRAAEAAGDEIAVDGCRALGDLAVATGRTLVMQKLGLGLQSTGIPEPPEWQRRFEAAVMTCAMPKFSLGNPGKMPDGEQLLWLQEMAELGEVVAARNKAIREYAIDPEAYSLDPARCGELETLSEAQREQIGERVAEGGLNAGLELAAQILEARS